MLNGNALHAFIVFLRKKKQNKTKMSENVLIYLIRVC